MKVKSDPLKKLSYQIYEKMKNNQLNSPTARKPIRLGDFRTQRNKSVCVTDRASKQWDAQ